METEKKDDGEGAVFLEVNLWGMEPGQFVKRDLKPVGTPK